MAVTPKGIVTPDSSSPYNLITDLNTLASTTDAAITNASNLLKGTAAQRVAFTSTATNGMLWQDTDGIKMIWRKDGAAWVPAVWRWSGTTAQMNGFTQAPNGFEWHNSTDNKAYTKLGGSWSPDVNVVQTSTSTYFSTSSTSFQATPLTASITPASTSSKILVTASFVAGSQAANGNGIASIFRGGIGGTNLGPASGLAQFWAGASSIRSSLSINILDSPASTSAVSYVLALRSVTGLVDFQPAGSIATLTLQELR